MGADTGFAELDAVLDRLVEHASGPIWSVEMTRRFAMLCDALSRDRGMLWTGR